MYQFHEDDLEQATLDWLSELGYQTKFGPDIAVDGDYPERDSYADVVLIARLEEALHRINPTASQASIERAIQLVTMIQSPNLIINNRNFQKYVTDGIDVEYRRNDTEDGLVLCYDDENTVITIQLDLFDAHLLQKRLKRAIQLYEL